MHKHASEAEITITVANCFTFSITSAKCGVLYFHFFLVTSMSDSITTTDESITFECSKYDSSMAYYGHVYEKDRSTPFSRIKCARNGCQCNATKLQPNTAYIVSLEACTSSQCKQGRHAMIFHTKPEGKLRICGTFGK